MRRIHDPVPESPFLTIAEVASILRISRPTVLRRLEDGTLPGLNVGTDGRKLWRCRRDQILALGMPEDRTPGKS